LVFFKMTIQEVTTYIDQLKKSGYNNKTVTRIQFGDVKFYQFLVRIGITSAKTKTIAKLKIPNKHFFDFLRGHLDGDGSFYSYWDPRWKSSFMFYTVFISASEKHIQWLQNKIYQLLKIKGHITTSKGDTTYHLKYAKRESVKLLKKIYYSKKVVCLSRKRLKIEKVLASIGLSL